MPLTCTISRNPTRLVYWCPTKITKGPKIFWIWKKFTSCLIFGAHKLVRSEPFLDYTMRIWQLLPALHSDVRKKLIQVHIYCSGILLKSVCYLLEVGRTNFFADFSSFRNFRTQFRENYGAIWRRKWELSSESEKNGENRIKTDQ